MSLNEIWEAAAGSPFRPIVSKDQQFLVAFTLLFIAFVLTGLFGLSKNIQPKPLSSVDVEKDRSFKNIPILGIPASLAFGFGAVYMICAVGVYV